MRLQAPKSTSITASLGRPSSKTIMTGSLFLAGFAMGLLSFSNNSYAREAVAVKLKTLQKVTQQEKDGDELYISVTEFPGKEHARHYQIPTYPAHWLSKYLVNVKDVVLWQKDFKECEPIDLLISLVEEDFEPWNIDDLLGSVELKVTCQNGKAVENWIIPNTKITSQISNQKNAFSFTGEKAQYKAVFEVQDVPARKATGSP